MANVFIPRCRGHILLTVLLFIQFLTVLVLFTLECSLHSVRMSHAERLNDFSLEKAQVLLARIENSLIDTLADCIIPIHNSSYFQELPLSFWQSPITCSGNFLSFQYYYVLERLAIDNCVEQETSLVERVEFIRITLLMYSSNQRVHKLLQSVIAKKHEGLGECEKEHRHPIQLGRQRWVEL